MPQSRGAWRIVQKVAPPGACGKEYLQDPGKWQGFGAGSVERFHARLFAAPEDGLHGAGGAGDDHVLIDGV